MRRNVTIFYDEDDFPQAVRYAEIFGIYAESLNQKLRYKLIAPTCQDYQHIYIACSESHMKLYADIISAHERFAHSFVQDVPDYRKMTLKEAADFTRSQGFMNPFDDVKKQKEKDAYAEIVAKAEENGVYLDPNPDEPLNADILKPKRRRRSNV